MVVVVIATVVGLGGVNVVMQIPEAAGTNAGTNAEEDDLRKVDANGGGDCDGGVRVVDGVG